MAVKKKKKILGKILKLFFLLQISNRPQATKNKVTFTELLLLIKCQHALSQSRALVLKANILVRTERKNQVKSIACTHQLSCAITY